ncbi:MAG: hypothetical protein GY942_19420 [Aestuariibacter sp.]|nr:hypothetical protein [Halieaceae bacterium]MCP5012153.1 hypothetical protein [Aestuariibacter sp.]
MKIYDLYTGYLSQGDGAQALAANPRAYKHQVYVAAAAGATGTVAVSFRPSHTESFIPLLDDADAQVVFDLSDPGQPAIFNGAVDAIQFSPTGVVGNYRGLAAGWVE